MKKCLFIVLLPLVNLAFGQNSTLSGEAQIRLVTCGPGQNELYSAFGHSAFRVTDPVLGIDWIYNYGVFDFNQPNFYLNFTRGHLNYKLAKHDYRPFRDFYIRENRFIIEQVLNLDREQTQKLFDFLEWNNLPENQYYMYDYFYDNCSTRPREAIVSALGNAVEFDTSSMAANKTIRQLTDDYLGYQAWGDLGIDICLGLPMDKVTNWEIQTFLPDYLKLSFDRAQIKTENGFEPFVLTTIDIYKENDAVPPESFFSPKQVFWGLFIVGTILTTMVLIRGKRKTWIDLSLYSITGVLGILLFLLWIVTDHNAAAKNFNMLWALPTNLIGVYLLLKKHRLTANFFKFMTFWYLIVAIAWFFLPQQMHFALFPLILLIIVRSYVSWVQSVEYGTKG